MVGLGCLVGTIVHLTVILRRSIRLAAQLTLRLKGYFGMAASIPLPDRGQAALRRERLRAAVAWSARTSVTASFFLSLAALRGALPSPVFAAALIGAAAVYGAWASRKVITSAVVESALTGDAEVADVDEPLSAVVRSAEEAAGFSFSRSVLLDCEATNIASVASAEGEATLFVTSGLVALLSEPELSAVVHREAVRSRVGGTAAATAAVQVAGGPLRAWTVKQVEVVGPSDELFNRMNRRLYLRRTVRALAVRDRLLDGEVESVDSVAASESPQPDALARAFARLAGVDGSALGEYDVATAHMWAFPPTPQTPLPEPLTVSPAPSLDERSRRASEMAASRKAGY